VISTSPTGEDVWVCSFPVRLDFFEGGGPSSPYATSSDPSIDRVGGTVENQLNSGDAAAAVKEHVDWYLRSTLHESAKEHEDKLLHSCCCIGLVNAVGLHFHFLINFMYFWVSKLSSSNSSSSFTLVFTFRLSNRLYRSLSLN